MKPAKQTVYLPIKMQEDRTNIPYSVPKERWGVHETHCCKKHGCKYGDKYCPVVLGHTKQVYECEDGYFDNGCFEPEVDELQKQEAFVFTSEQLNEYTANVIKQALETAARKSETEERHGWMFVNKESITNTFEETCKKFEV